MAEEEFVLENGIVTNENIPLILQGDLHDSFEGGNELVQLNVDGQLFDFDYVHEGEDQQLLPGSPKDCQGLINDSGVSSSQISAAVPEAQSSFINLNVGEMLAISYPGPSNRPFVDGRGKEGYFSNVSELSDSSRSKKYFIDITGISSRMGNALHGICAQPSTSRLAFPTKPPNSKNLTALRVRSTDISPEEIGPMASLLWDRTQQMESRRPRIFLLQFGCFLIFVLVTLVLVMLACNENLCNKKYIKDLGIAWIVLFVLTVFTFVMVCQNIRRRSERTNRRSGELTAISQTYA